MAPDPQPSPPPIPYTSKGEGHHPVAKQTELVPPSWKVNDEPLWWKRRVRALPGCCPSPAPVLGLFTRVTWRWTHGPWGLRSCPRWEPQGPRSRCFSSAHTCHLDWVPPLPQCGPCPCFLLEPLCPARPTPVCALWSLQGFR